MGIETVVIEYRADINDVQQKVLSLQRLNTALAQRLGADFSKGMQIVKDEISNVKFDKKFKIVADDNKLKTVMGTISTFEKTVQTADGRLFKFTETIGKADEGSRVLSSTLKQLAGTQTVLSGQASQLKTNFTSLTSVNQRFGEQLTTFGKATNFLGTSLNQLSNDGSKISKIFETSNGKFVQLTETTKQLPGGIQQVNRTVKELSKAQLENITTLEGANKSSRSFGDNLSSLLKRAALTIPVWFALRQGIASVFRTITNGLKGLVDFDLALQKVKRNLQGTPLEIQQNFKVLKDEITEFSLQTGISVEDLSESVKKFASLGFDFKESLAGGLGAAKLSILLFGNAAETADSFARALNLLIDRSKGAKDPIEQMNELFALTAELEKTNQFEISEVNEALKNFAGTAKSLGITGKETLAILASLGTNLMEGARGGTAASSAFQQLIKNLNKTASVLGLSVNPKTESTTAIFLKIIEAIEQLGKVDIVGQTAAINKLFGGLKGAKPVRALIADLQRLKANLKVDGNIADFNAQIENLLNTSIAELTKQIHNLNKEIGKAFVSGIVGGKDFQETLQNIIVLQKTLIDKTEILGVGLSNAWKFLNFLVDTASIGGQDFAFNFLVNQKQFEKQTKNITDQTLASFDKLIAGVNGKLSRMDLDRLIAEVKTKIKISKVDVSLDKDAVLPQVLVQLEKQLSDLPAIPIKIPMQLDSESLLPEDQAKLIESLIKDQLERLKIDGATESQVLKIEDALRKEYDTEYKLIQQKQQQLDIERAITEEQKKRITFSDESVKLAEIAKTEGLQTAIAVGEVLNNQRDFNTFIRQGGKQAEILKTHFEDFVKNKELENFFSGVRTPGKDFVRGGERIPITELPNQDFSSIRAKSQFTDAQKRLGLQEIQTKNVSALEANTISLQSLIETYKLGLPLQGQQAQRFVESQALQKQIDLNITVNGQNFRYQGTEAGLDKLYEELSPSIKKAFKEEMIKTSKDFAEGVQNEITNNLSKGTLRQ